MLKKNGAAASQERRLVYNARVHYEFFTPRPNTCLQ